MPRAEPICRSRSEIQSVPCPCGQSCRIITAADDAVMGFHVTTIDAAEPHYHRRTTEIYYVLEGTGTLTVADQSVALSPGSTVYVPPGCVHFGDGGFTAAIVCMPPFDATDEFILADAPPPADAAAPIVRHFDEIEPIRSSCGASTRILTRADGVPVGLHVVHIWEAEMHYHNQITEIYHILSGSGALTVGEETFDLAPGVTVYVPAGLPHGGEGDFTAIVVCAPPFDPTDQIMV